MIPILYEKDEVAFTRNGIGRLRDCTSCVVTEERNGIFECDFEYPLDGANFDQIIPGRIIAVTHDETGDVQPFDIVSYSKPIDGVVTFHAVHISYRLTKMTVWGTNINSLSSALTMLGNAKPNMPFSFRTDKTVSAFMGAADGTPRSVRQMLGGVEGSILDTYGGEYEWNGWEVILWAQRGAERDFTIRYGLNLLEYQEDTDYTETYSAIIPFWSGQDDDGKTLIVRGDMKTANAPSYTGRTECVPMDFTDKFESKPSKAQVNSMGQTFMASQNTVHPQQTITVDFIRLTDSPEYAEFAQLQNCRLCDTVRVEFPRYGMSGKFKIVKTEYDVLSNRYTQLELGTLSTSLAEALSSDSSGINNSAGIIDSWAYVTAITATTISATSSPKKIPITSIDLKSDDGNFSYNNTDKGVQIALAGTYVVSVETTSNTVTSGDLMGVSVYKNGSDATDWEYNRMGGTYDSVILAPTPIEVASGDVLTVYGRNNTGARGTFNKLRFFIKKLRT